MKEVLKNAKLVHVCVVTDDIDQCKKILGEWLGMKPPETEVLAVTNITYKGQPAPKLGCRQMSFQISDFVIELIEPNKEKSAWNEYLQKKGPGLHHLCFEVPNLAETVDGFRLKGLPPVQTGEFEGGRYAYVDATKEIGTYLELLEMY